MAVSRLTLRLFLGVINEGRGADSNLVLVRIKALI